MSSAASAANPNSASGNTASGYISGLSASDGQAGNMWPMLLGVLVLLVVFIIGIKDR